MKWLKRLLAVAVVVLLGWWAAERLLVTDAQRIQRQIRAMTRAVEQGNLWRLESAIANDYSDDFGLDKSTLLGAVRGYRQQHVGLFIHVADLRVEIGPDRQRAEAVFVAQILVRSVGGGGTTELLADRFRLFFRKAGQDWLLVRAESPQLKFE